MSRNRRDFLVFAAVSAGLPLLAAPLKVAARPISVLAFSALGRNAADFGFTAGSDDDQSRILECAIDETARAGVPLAIAPGRYRIAGVTLPSHAQLIGVRGASLFVFGGGPSLLATENAESVTLSGLSFDGMNKPLAQERGLIHCENARKLSIGDCAITDAGGNGIHCVGVDGEIADNSITGAQAAAIHSLDAKGLLIARNSIGNAGDNGIQVWRSDKGDDGTIVTDNRIAKIANRSGGSGQYGNGVNIFRAANVIVRGNRINACAFSAVRGNAASDIVIEGNQVSDAGEVALYSEFGFEGAAIGGNSIDGAAIGIAVTNFNQGGRLAVIQGNLIRNLKPKRPAGTDPSDLAGVGISAEADAAITGNVVENAPLAGLVLGFGPYLRDIAATGNVVRRASIGAGVSVAVGAGSALIADNVFSSIQRAAIAGMDRDRIVTGDLTKEGARNYPNLAISGNRVS